MKLILIYFLVTLTSCGGSGGGSSSGSNKAAVVTETSTYRLPIEISKSCSVGANITITCTGSNCVANGYVFKLLVNSGMANLVDDVQLTQESDGSYYGSITNQIGQYEIGFNADKTFRYYRSQNWCVYSSNSGTLTSVQSMIAAKNIAITDQSMEDSLCAVQLPACE